MLRKRTRSRKATRGSPLKSASGEPITVVHLTAEYTPYARTGGLAEAVQGLADVQTRMGINVFVVVPLYRTVRSVAKNLVQIGDENQDLFLKEAAGSLLEKLRSESN